jgi:hypothetical protein
MGDDHPVRWDLGDPAHPMRKTFPCGHKGKGAHCHRCSQLEGVAQAKQAALVVKQERAQARKEAFSADLVDLKGLPQVVIDKARAVIADLGAGANWVEMGGVKFNARKEIIRFKLPMHYRMVCKMTSNGLVPLAVMTHEAYNKWM